MDDYPFKSVIVMDERDEFDGWVVAVATDEAGRDRMSDPDTSSRWFATKEEADDFSYNLGALFCIPVIWLPKED